MNFEMVWEYLMQAKVPTILGLISLDVAFGIWSAVRSGEFEWEQVGNFYRTNVIPYLGGYLTVYVATQFVPQATKMVADGLNTLLWAPLVANLVSSIIENLRELQVELPEK